MKRIRVKEIYANKKEEHVVICAWVRTNRAQAQFGFLNVNDGSTLTNLQVIYENNLSNFEEISKYRVGSSVMVEGNIKLTPVFKYIVKQIHPVSNASPILSHTQSSSKLNL